MKRLLILTCILAVLAVIAAACGGGGDDDDAATGSPAPSGEPTLEDMLASVLLLAGDVPAGLQGAGPNFSTNADIASGEEDLNRINATGRLLGADIQYIPTDQLDDSSPLRGGIQSSASVYSSIEGASSTYQATRQVALDNDWAANYPDLENVTVTQIDRPVGDESLWLRVTGLEECEYFATETPGPDETPLECPDRLVILDNVVFRSERMRGYVLVNTVFTQDHDIETVYVDEVLAWTNLMAQRGAETFPQ